MKAKSASCPSSVTPAHPGGIASHSAARGSASVFLSGPPHPHTSSSSHAGLSLPSSTGGGAGGGHALNQQSLVVPQTFGKLKHRTNTGPEFDPQKYERPGMKQEEIIALKKIFDACDVENCGSIQLRDLKTRMLSAGYESKNEVIGDVVSYLDRDGRTVLTFPQFLDLLAADDSAFRSREDISRTFAQFDPDNTGHITLKMLLKTARELNMPASGSNPDISEILSRCDTNNDGKISELEFHAVMDKQTFP